MTYYYLIGMIDWVICATHYTTLCLVTISIQRRGHLKLRALAHSHDKIRIGCLETALGNWRRVSACRSDIAKNLPDTLKIHVGVSFTSAKAMQCHTNR